MKKILGFVVVALLIVWVASLLYVGHQTEKMISQYVNQINQVYQQTYPGVELELRKFDSNFFDAKAQYAIKVDIRKLMLNFGLDKNNLVALENIFKNPFIVDQDIQYGPVFFDDGLKFAMAKISFQSTLNNFVKAIAEEFLPRFEADQQKNKEQLDIFISNLNQALEKKVVINFESFLPLFSNEIHTNGTIGEISFNEKGTLFTIGKMTFNDVVNMQKLTKHSNLNIPNIIFKHRDGQIFEVQKLSISADINEFIDTFNYFGDIKFDAQKVNFNLPTGEDVSFAAAFNFKSSKNNKISNLYNSEINIIVKMLKLPKQAEAAPFDLPETVSVSWALNGINNAEFTNTIQKLQHYISTIGADNAKLTKIPTYLINDIANGLDKSFVKQATNFNIDFDITTFKQQKINNTLSFQLIYDFDKGDMVQLLTMINNDNLKKASEFIKNKIIINLQVKVNTKLLEKFKPILQTQIQQGIVTEKYGFYQTNANYQNKKLMINGKDMSAILQQLSSPPAVPTTKVR